MRGGDEAVKVCTHPPDQQLYMQLNSEPSMRITVADLIGGINPYVWRVEYCGVCHIITRSLGDVPQSEVEAHSRLHRRWARIP